MMLLENNVPKELSASITEVLGPTVTTTIRRLVKVETRPDKQEQKALVLSDHRLHVFAAKVPTKEELSIHFLNLQGIESKDIKLIFKYEGRKLVLYAIDNPSEIDKVVFQIADSLVQIFPHLPLENLTGPLDISPPERMKNVSEQLKNKTLHREMSPCGNFSAQYRCMCDYHGQPYLEEVSWDVDTIYLSQNCKALILTDFDHLDSKYLTPIISALSHNTWFTTLCGCNVKLTQEAINEYANVLRTNTTIDHVCVMNSQLKSDAAQKIANAISANIKDTAVNSLHFMGNAIEDKGVQALSPVIAKLPKGLEKLNLSKCRLQTPGVNKLAEALYQNQLIPTTLTMLDLSGNSLKDDVTDKESSNLFNFLGQPNALINLNLSGTECALDNIFGALLRGCSSNLVHLDLSGNPFSNKRTGSRQADTMVPVSWKQFFASSVALQSVSVARTRLPLDAIKNLLLGINSNVNFSSVSVNLSDTALGSQGAQLLETCMGQNLNIIEMDLSDNDLNADLIKILQKLTRNNHLKKLNIGKNFQGLKPKHIPVVLEALVELLNADDSALESLSLADSKLKGDTVMIINALGGNASLLELDISGNIMCDFGARMLAKALAINSKLQVVHWDRNNVSPQGYTDISLALSKNFTLRKMPTPIQDVTNALKINQDKTQQSLYKIEEYLRRNNSPRKYGSEQAYRLQQGFLLSTTQQTIDKYIVNILDIISDLEKNEVSEEVTVDIETARKVMSDAENCRELLLQLQKIGQKCEASGNDLEIKLKHMSVDLQLQLAKQVKNTVSEMCRCAEAKCLSIMESDKMKDKLKQGCEEKSSLPKDFCKTLLMEQVATELYNKMSEVNVAVASHISDELIDLLIESLDKCNSELESHKSSESKLDQEARKSILRVKDKEVELKPEPTVNRKSVYSRKVRPVSTVASESPSPQASETDLDGFVLVQSDDGSDAETTHRKSNTADVVESFVKVPPVPVPDKPTRLSWNFETTSTKSDSKDRPSPGPSPRNSGGGGIPSRRVTPPKPPPPSGIKKTENSSPTNKYMLQGGGEHFAPSAESKTTIDGLDKPRPTPRRRHVKDEKDNSLNRISEMSLSDDSRSPNIVTSQKMIKRESSSSQDSLLSAASMDNSITSESKTAEETEKTNNDACDKTLSTVKDDKLLPTVKGDKPLPTVRDDKPLPTVKDDKPLPTARDNKPLPTVKDDKPLPTVKDDKPLPTVKNDKPLPTARDNKPLPTVKDDKPLPTVKEIVSNKKGKKKTEKKSSSSKKTAPPVPSSTDGKHDLEENSSDEEDQKEDKSTGDDLTESTTDTGSVDSLLEESPPPPEKVKQKAGKLFRSLQNKSKDKPDKADKAVPKSKSEKLSSSKTGVSDFDVMAPTTTNKLGNLEFSRPKRAKTRPTMPGNVVIKSESEVIDEVDTGISDFYETKNVPKQHVVPTESTKHKEQKMNLANASDEKVKVKKKPLMPPGVKGISSGISDFFKKKDKTMKSPEGNKESSPIRTSDVKTSASKESSPMTEAPKPRPISTEKPRPISTEKETVNKQEKEEEEKEKTDEPKAPERPSGPRLPPGAKAIPFLGGGGAALLKEMKTKRATVMRTDDKKEPSPSRDSVKPTAPARPPSLYPKLPSEVTPKQTLPQRSMSASDEAKAADTKPAENKLPEKPPPPTRPKPVKQAPAPAHPSAPARPGVGPSRANTMANKPSKQPAPSIPGSSTTSRGYSDTDDAPNTNTDESSEKPKERDPVKRRSSIKDRIAMLDANSNEKATISAVDKGSPKTKPRPLSTNLLKESQDKNVDDSAGSESRPKSIDLDRRPQSMFPGTALNAELSSRMAPPPKPLAPMASLKKALNKSNSKDSNKTGNEDGENSSEESSEGSEKEESSSRKSGTEEIYL